VNCGYSGANLPSCEIDQLVMGSDAVSAVHTTSRDYGCTCTVEQIQASDRTGMHTLDSITEPDGSPPALTKLTSTGTPSPGSTTAHHGAPNYSRKAEDVTRSPWLLG
jgi:hypothetical protein